MPYSFAMTENSNELDVLTRWKVPTKGQKILYEVLVEYKIPGHSEVALPKMAHAVEQEFTPTQGHSKDLGFGKIHFPAQDMFEAQTLDVIFGTGMTIRYTDKEKSGSIGTMITKSTTQKNVL